MRGGSSHGRRARGSTAVAPCAHRRRQRAWNATHPPKHPSTSTTTPTLHSHITPLPSPPLCAQAPASSFLSSAGRFRSRAPSGSTTYCRRETAHPFPPSPPPTRSTAHLRAPALAPDRLPAPCARERTLRRLLAPAQTRLQRPAPVSPSSTPPTGRPCTPARPSSAPRRHPPFPPTHRFCIVLLLPPCRHTPHLPHPLHPLAGRPLPDPRDGHPAALPHHLPPPLQRHLRLLLQALVRMERERQPSHCQGLPAAQILQVLRPVLDHHLGLAPLLLPLTTHHPHHHSMVSAIPQP